jgi:hypothetical protein
MGYSAEEVREVSRLADTYQGNQEAEEGETRNLGLIISTALLAISSSYLPCTAT